MAITTDMSKVKDSRCFGIAWDGEAPECKICEVANICKQRTLGNVKQAPNTAPKTMKKSSAPEKKSDVAEANEKTTMKPTTKRPEPKDEEKKPAPTKKSTKKAKTEEKNYDPAMPDFRPMDCDELMNLAIERGLKASDFDKYTNTSIRKMRITMALKKTYEV